MLEYAAQEAFFIGQSAQRLFVFDERTRQSALAPEIKRRALGGLSEAALHGVFSDYSTANAELLKYLKWRAARVRDAASHPVYELDPELPVIFRPKTSYASNPPPTATEAQAKLIRSEHELLTAAEKAD
ncbi:MAG: hypothetical protein HZA46_24630, partial [Planctomycetales bacterium]|nr:hypothetical protein [Planctomycetales bacterium]